MKNVFLTLAAAKQMIGKQFSWRAECAPENGQFYSGTAIIKAVDSTKEYPLTVETVSGDNLSLAYPEGKALVPIEGTTGYKAVNADGDDRCLTYSDDYREVEIVDNK